MRDGSIIAVGSINLNIVEYKCYKSVSRTHILAVLI